jgi:phosphatidylserine/phosphatidylglycerophosphate/cardiolipin synthase-like enzyme
LGNDPLVVSGSANFSRPSQRQNDENMLVIRGDTRVADIYLGEYMRVFDHHYARYLVKKLSAIDPATADSGYLKIAADDWLPGHFIGAKRKRRNYFAETPAPA